MSYDWRELLELADFLKEGHGRYSPEAAFRSAVSRAYYAAFCHARNYARDNHGFKPSYDVEDHKNVSNHYRSLNMLEIVQKLMQMRLWRNTCDYDDRTPPIENLVRFAISHSRGVIKQLK